MWEIQFAQVVQLRSSTTVANAGGVQPTYSWTINGSPVSGSGSTYSYVPTDGDVVGVSMTSSAVCATPATIGTSLTLSVMANGNPTISREQHLPAYRFAREHRLPSITSIHSEEHQRSHG